MRAQFLVKPFVMAILFDVCAFGAKGLGVRSKTDTSLAQNMNGYGAQNVIDRKDTFRYDHIDYNNLWPSSLGVRRLVNHSASANSKE